jgi:hypothetical protein
VAHTHNPPSLRRQRQEEHKFKASLGYIVSPCAKKKKKKRRKEGEKKRKKREEKTFFTHPRQPMKWRAMVPQILAKAGPAQCAPCPLQVKAASVSYRNG